MDTLNTHTLSTLSDTGAPARTIQRGQADRGSLRGPFHAKTRLLAQERRNRDPCPVPAMLVDVNDRRIPDRETLTREVRAGQDQRNADTKPVEWRFTTDDARIKLKSLYPSIQ